MFKSEILRRTRVGNHAQYGRKEQETGKKTGCKFPIRRKIPNMEEGGEKGKKGAFIELLRPERGWRKKKKERRQTTFPRRRKIGGEDPDKATDTLDANNRSRWGKG